MRDGNWRYILTHFNLACCLEIGLLNFHTSNQLEAIETIVILRVLISEPKEDRRDRIMCPKKDIKCLCRVAKKSDIKRGNTPSSVRLKHIDAEQNIKKSCLMDFSIILRCCERSLIHFKWELSSSSNFFATLTRDQISSLFMLCFTATPTHVDCFAYTSSDKFDWGRS